MAKQTVGHSHHKILLSNKRKGLLILAATGMDLEKIRLHQEVSQKVTYNTISFMPHF